MLLPPLHVFFIYNTSPPLQGILKACYAENQISAIVFKEHNTCFAAYLSKQL